MRVCAAGDDSESGARKSRGEGAGVGDDLFLILAESRLCRFLQADSLRCDDMFQRAALKSRESELVEFLGEFVAAHHQAAARAAQSFVRSRGNKIGVRHGAGMNA